VASATAGSTPGVEPHVAPVPTVDAASDADVSADLARDNDRRDTSYKAVAADLERQLVSARAGWPDDRRRDYDAQLGALTHAVESARDHRPRHTAWRAKIRFLQRALVRDEVASR
jgi:hypothetical protein